MYDEPRLEALLDAYFDQELKAGEREELEQLLLSSARAREVFWQRAQNHSSIREWGMQEWGRKLAEEPAATEPAPAAKIDHDEPSFEPAGSFSRPWRGLWGWVTAAAACIALLVALWGPPTPGDLASADDETPDAAVAVLTRAAGVSWADTNNTLSPGEPIQPGWLKLKEGVIHLEFYSGARLIIEAPAEVQLISATEAYCQYGKLNAYVPEQAQGFVVRSPGVDLVDLGTAFGMNIPAGGPSEVHVFGGKVELTRAGTQAIHRHLTEGQAMQIDTVGQLTEIQSEPDGFVTLPELTRRESIELSQRLDAWRTANQKIDRDPATLVHYTFEGEPNGDRRVKNNVPNAAASTEGSIVSCEWVGGRWPGKPALEFKSRSDRIRLGVPGKHDALTLTAWVRIDSLTRAYNTLLLSDDLGVGEVRWDITSKGELRFGTRVASNAFERAVSPAIITPDRFGQWLHLATVFDGKSQTVRHYLNGKEVTSTRLNRVVPLVLGNSEIGNWGVRADNARLLQKDEAYLSRAFSGCIDEFTLSARAMSAREIQERYEIGKPVATISLATADP